MKITKIGLQEHLSDSTGKKKEYVDYGKKLEVLRDSVSQKWSINHLYSNLCRAKYTDSWVSTQSYRIIIIMKESL